VRVLLVCEICVCGVNARLQFHLSKVASHSEENDVPSIILVLYRLIHVYPIYMNTSKRLSWFDLEIYEVSHQKRLIINRDVVSH
jgi:hypothetical protein